MTADLLGVWEKVERAGEHLDTLQREWGEAVERNREHLFAPLQFDPASGWYRSNIGRLDLPYLRLAVIGGEAAYQLRSALEHLAQALVKANGAEPHLGTSFPIRIWPPYEPDFHTTTSTTSLRGVCDEAIDLIGREQPYLRGSEESANAHYLATLKSFADTDKHRTLFVAATVPSDVDQFRQIYRIPAALDVDFRLLIDPGQRLEPGSPVAAFRALGLVSEQTQRDVFIHGDLTLSIEFGDGHAPHEHRGSLQLIRNNVIELVRSCEGFFLY